jgi:hypothetical protein
MRVIHRKTSNAGLSIRMFVPAGSIAFCLALHGSEAYLFATDAHPSHQRWDKENRC